MPVRRKQVKKSVEPVEKARLQKQLRLIAQEVKRLDAHIQELTKTCIRGNYRML
jgi:hypothetical protein